MFETDSEEEEEEELKKEDEEPPRKSAFQVGRNRRVMPAPAVSPSADLHAGHRGVTALRVSCETAECWGHSATTAAIWDCVQVRSSFPCIETLANAF